jgi:hypothetical protein
MHWTKRYGEQGSVMPRRTMLRLASALAGFVVVCGCRSNQPTEVQPMSVQPQPTAQTPAPPPTPPSPKAENVPPAELVIENVGISLDPQMRGPELIVRARNAGGSAAEVSGGCQWKCPVVIQQVNGFLQTEDGSLVNAGQDKVLNYGGGIDNVCDGNKLPLPLSCNFSVQTLDSHMQKVGAAQTVRYSQTVTLTTRP